MNPARSVVMVRPASFGFNPETAQDNEFQSPPSADDKLIGVKANLEFESMANHLLNAGVNVLVLEPDPELPALPDAVFPNNWFATTGAGELILFPMKSPSREREKRRDDLQLLLTNSGYEVAMVRSITSLNGSALEGTGAMVLDHQSHSVFACLSERCNEALLHDFSEQWLYQPCHAFTALSRAGKPFYHTNIILSIGLNFAVFCAESVPSRKQRIVVERALQDSGKTLIRISLEQAEEHFCGNILQLASANGDPVIAMSETARRGFSAEQIEALEQHGQLVPCSIDTIETVGGGSARCMLAENFLPLR